MHQPVTVYALHTADIQQMDWTPLYTAMPERIKKAERFRFEKDRLLCIGAGLLLLYALPLRDETELQTGPYGKLFIPGKRFFNLSHSGHWCMLAVSDMEIGADIEEIRESNVSIASSIYSPREIEWMNEQPLDRFHLLWTWKESVMKATGLGLNLNPKSIDVLPFTQDKPISLNGRTWYAKSGNIPGYRYSICTAHPVDNWNWVDGSALIHPSGQETAN